MLFSRPLRLVALLLGWGLVFSLSATESHAQRQDTTSVLPDIAPREVEIRGQLEISPRDSSARAEAAFGFLVS